VIDDVLKRLEADLTKIPGIQRASVIGEHSPTEIHVVAAADRPPKQVVRDVQSLASAGFGLTIDHRIVSVVQLEHEQVPAETARPVVEELIITARGDSGTVEVRLRWPDGQTTSGMHPITSSREGRAKGAVEAVVRALHPVLESRSARVDIGQVVIQRSSLNDSVVVEAHYTHNGALTPLIGSAFIHDDVATAAVKALLQAVNRKLL
jgi:hypothetical protein